MSIRSNWCEYDKDTRKYIKKRDDNKCIICGNKGALQVMHIFLSRAKGGKGCKENGCLGCVKCHQIIDNPIGKEQNKLSKIYLSKCKRYLKIKEKIIDEEELIKKLKFNKQEYYNSTINIKPIENKILKKQVERCKNCNMLIKIKDNSNSIPTYFCKYKKIRLNKTTKACDKFRR